MAERDRTRFAIYTIALIQALNAVALALAFVTDTDAAPLLLEDEEGGVVVGLLAVLGLAASAGLFLLKRWAWVAAMLWVGIVMAGQLIDYFESGGVSYAVMLLSVMFVLYFNRTEVQQLFLPGGDEKDGPG